MTYCPFCAEKLLKPAKICPYCKKSIDPQLFKEMYGSAGGPSHLDRKLLMKRWFKEHSLFIYPMMALLIGLIIGIILAYSYALIQFSGERSDYQKKITELENTLQKQKTTAGNLESDFQNQLDTKNNIIKILLEQKELLSRLIYFTNRLSENSTLTPNTPEDIDNYRRNTLYIIQLFNESQTKLKSAGLEDNKAYYLQTVPSLLQTVTN